MWIQYSLSFSSVLGHQLQREMSGFLHVAVCLPFGGVPLETAAADNVDEICEIDPTQYSWAETHYESRAALLIQVMIHRKFIIFSHYLIHFPNNIPKICIFFFEWWCEFCFPYIWRIRFVGQGISVAPQCIIYDGMLWHIFSSSKMCSCNLDTYCGFDDI